MPDNLNPILNPDCECPAEPVETPTPCETPNPVDFVNEVLDTPCPSCEDEIVPPPPTIPDLTLTQKCFDIDPAYSFLQAVDLVEGSGNVHYFLELHPACARPIQQCQFCVDEVTCPEDIGLVYRKGFDNVFTVEMAGAVQPILFWVHDSHLDRIMSEVGYVKVMQHNMRNEWIPRDQFQTEFAISPSQMLPMGIGAFLNEKPMIGTVPTVFTETPITSVLD